MSGIYDLVEKISPLDFNTHLADVLAYFREHKKVAVVPVVMDGCTPVGILREMDLKEYVYSPFGKEILLNTSIKKCINDFLVHCSVADIDANLEQILKLFSVDENKEGIIISKNGEYVGFLSAFSILKMLSEKQVEEKFARTIDSIVVGVAHEINTPLGISITATSYIQDRLKEIQNLVNEKRLKKTDMEQYLKSLAEASETLYGNLHRVANMTSILKKVSVNRHFEEKRTFRVVEAINFAKDLVLSKIGKTKHKIEVNCEEDLEITTCFELFTEVISNILENALEHAFDDEKNGHITLLFKREGGSLIFVCTDDGKGVDEASAKKIFEPFYTTKRNGGKIGLGLNIVQNILIHRLNGTMSCESKKGHGATFTIKIPAK